MGIGFLLQLFLARTMSLTEFGDFTFVLSGALILSQVAGAGMTFAALRFVPRYRVENRPDLLRGFMMMALALVLVTGAVIVIVDLFYAERLLDAEARPGLRAAMWAGAWLAALIGMSNLLGTMLQADRRVLVSEAMQNALRPLAVILLCGVWLLAGQRLDAPTAIWLFSLATLGLVAVMGLMVARLIGPAVRGHKARFAMRQWLASGLSMLLVLSSAILNERLDVILVGMQLGTEQSGIYAIAARLAQILALGTASVNTLLAPTISERHAAKDQEGLQALMTRGARLACLFTVPAGLGLVVLGSWVLGLFGAPFRAGYGTLVVLVLSQVLTAMCGTVGGLMVLTGHNRPVIVALSLGLAANVGLNLLLVPLLGIIGAALATLTAWLLANIGMVLWTRRRLGIDTTILGQGAHA
ncbi:MAG: polysaccharide biosynthesis C-terminal domain-containing protein [Alphaproteobacteria bacterium]|nr:polysaccharide biosynthesis C-terminal domain-containing protein [Alphaproteobacteria bacterium]